MFMSIEFRHLDCRSLRDIAGGQQAERCLRFEFGHAVSVPPALGGLVT
jgi:hypothetical protein